MIQFKRLFKLGEKEVLKLVEYDDDIFTAPQWVPIWRLWSPSGLFTVFGPRVADFSISNSSVDKSPPFFSLYFIDFKLIAHNNRFVKNALLSPHFYRLKSLLFGKIQFRNNLLTMIFYQIQFKKLFIFQFFNKIQFKKLFI